MNPPQRNLRHVRADGHELDTLLDLLFWSPIEALAVEVISCPERGQGVVEDFVEPLALENLLGAVGKGDGHGGAGGKMPAHSDEALGILPEGDHYLSTLSVLGSTTIHGEVPLCHSDGLSASFTFP